MENYICVHGHFYQPPRENPWLDAIERQESAQPYHDWNQRVSAECYAPNGIARILDDKGCIAKIVNNYSRISFNFGPTLLSWLEANEPETYTRILEADRESRDHFSGHGSAMAQGYNHAILPLCNARDKSTQILWGVRDFVRRFGRQPEGMWLPETAVDLQSLDLMARQGIKFAILAPHQAKRFRVRGESRWREVTGCGIDTSMAYEIELPAGRTMALFFYDGAISNAVGFQKLLSDGASFAGRLMGGFSPECSRPQLMHMAVDGETFGHHHRFGEMALAWALDKIESEGKARLTNYGEFLEKYPPTHQVEIWENSSWSCCHGVSRWYEDCGCSTGANPGWKQGWRTPLRRALNVLRDRLEPLYAAGAGELLLNPWVARDDYIELVQDRSPEAVERFLLARAVRPFAPKERVRVLKLLEMQHQALLMFTSCGWFFDDIAGIEALQVLQYAGRAIQLAGELFGEVGIESSFLEILQEAKSNRPEMGNGRDLYRQFVQPAAIDDAGIAAHYAFRSLFQTFPERADFYSRTIEHSNLQINSHGGAKLLLGSCRVTSNVTTETTDVEFAAIHPWNAQVCLRVVKTGDAPPVPTEGIFAAFEKDDLATVCRLMRERFGDRRLEMKNPGGLGSLGNSGNSGVFIKDERREIFDCLLGAAEDELERLERLGFDCIAPVVDSMSDSGMTLPPRLAAVAATQLHARMLDEFRARPVCAERIRALLETADARNVKWDRNMLEPKIRRLIEQLAHELRLSPESPAALRNLVAAVRAEQTLPFAVDLHETQTRCYFLLQDCYSGLKALVEKEGDEAVATRLEEFRVLGALLSMSVEGVRYPSVSPSS
ncbi:MAG: DUF3536 domain-containing protein [Acidobacteriota bacterium]|jgi:alpha-amylase/alpha-mannosidase (GH57 family)|nr:DUF3536 domain-containing protein [Acidobacteriota bacterium]